MMFVWAPQLLDLTLFNLKQPLS